MNFFSEPPSRDILIEQVKDTLGIGKIRAMLFPAAAVLFVAMKTITSLPISNLVLVFFGYFWISSLLVQYLIEKWKNTPRIIAVLDIGRGLFLIEIVLNLLIIYYLSPIFIYLFGSSVWLAFFFYLFYAGAEVGLAGYSYGRGYINTCFLLSSLCCAVVFFWEYSGIAPSYESLAFLPGSLYQKSIPSLILFLLLMVVFTGARSFNSEIWKKIREVNRQLSQKTEELEGLNEELEKRVEERTEELEEAKTVLEIKVEARTRELRGFTEGLEEEVQRRTKEVQERMKALERFQKLTVGRELKMIASKEEIKRLEEELEKLRKHESRIY